jgi:hypothetical protein
MEHGSQTLTHNLVLRHCLLHHGDVKGVLLILVQDVQIALQKTVLDFGAQLLWIVCLVAGQSEGTVSVEMKV